MRLLHLQAIAAAALQKFKLHMSGHLKSPFTAIGTVTVKLGNMV